MNKLITVKNGYITYQYINELTKELDKNIKTKDVFSNTYIYTDEIKGKYILRYPGLSIGYIEVDDNHIIKYIKIYEDAFNILKMNKLFIDNIINKYINYKLLIIG